MKDPVILEAETKLRNLRIDLKKKKTKTCTVGCSRRIRIRYWDARREAAQYPSAVLITLPKTDKACILTHTQIIIKRKKKKKEVRGGRRR